MIEQAIDTINSNILIRSNQLCEHVSGQLYGLSEPILIRSEHEEDMTTFPAVVDNDGEAKYVFADDDYSFGVYHRLIKRSYTQDKKNGYGDSGYRDICMDEILLVCWGFRDQVNMSGITFEKQIIIPSLPKDAMLEESVFNQFQVFGNEFKNVTYNLKPEQFLFSVKYKVQYPFNRKCVEIDNNCNKD